MANVNTLIISDFDIPTNSINEIVFDKLNLENDNTYDIISWPNLSGILASKKPTIEEKLIKNYLFYSIGKLIIIHPTIKIIAYLFPHIESTRYFSKIFSHLYPIIRIEPLIYIIKNECIKFYDLEKEYEKYCEPIINFRCSDGLLSRIYSNSLNSSENPLKVNHGYNICLPGSTLWTSLSEERKILIGSIVDEIETKNIKEVLIDHHGPNCNAFVSYHRIEGELEIERSRQQHRINIENAWEIFSKLNIKVNARYLEFNDDKIIEYAYKMEPLQQLDIKRITNYGFDFNNYIFTETQTILA